MIVKKNCILVRACVRKGGGCGLLYLVRLFNVRVGGWGYCSLSILYVWAGGERAFFVYPLLLRAPRLWAAGGGVGRAAREPQREETEAGSRRAAHGRRGAPWFPP